MANIVTANKLTDVFASFYDSISSLCNKGPSVYAVPDPNPNSKLIRIQNLGRVAL